MSLASPYNPYQSGSSYSQDPSPSSTSYSYQQQPASATIPPAADLSLPHLNSDLSTGSNGAQQPQSTITSFAERSRAGIDTIDRFDEFVTRQVQILQREAAEHQQQQQQQQGSRSQPTRKRSIATSENMSADLDGGDSPDSPISSGAGVSTSPSSTAVNSRGKRGDVTLKEQRRRERIRKHNEAEVRRRSNLAGLLHELASLVNVDKAYKSNTLKGAISHIHKLEARVMELELQNKKLLQQQSHSSHLTLPMTSSLPQPNALAPSYDGAGANASHSSGSLMSNLMMRGSSAAPSINSNPAGSPTEGHALSYPQLTSQVSDISGLSNTHSQMHTFPQTTSQSSSISESALTSYDGTTTPDAVEVPANWSPVRPVVTDTSDSALNGAQEVDHYNVFHTSVTACYVVEMSTGKIVDCNERFSQLVQYPRNDLLHQNTTFLQLTAAESVDTAYQVVQALLAAYQAQREVAMRAVRTYITKYNRPIKAAVTSWLVHGENGECKYRVCMAEPLEFVPEYELPSSMPPISLCFRHSDLFDSSTLPMDIVDLSTYKIVDANKAMLKMLEYDKHVLLNQPEGIFTITATRSQNECFQLIQTLVANYANHKYDALRVIRYYVTSKGQTVKCANTMWLSSNAQYRLSIAEIVPAE